MGLCEERINLVVCEFYKKRRGGKKNINLRLGLTTFLMDKAQTLHGSIVVFADFIERQLCIFLFLIFSRALGLDNYMDFFHGISMTFVKFVTVMVNTNTHYHERQ